MTTLESSPSSQMIQQFVAINEVKFPEVYALYNRFFLLYHQNDKELPIPKWNQIIESNHQLVKSFENFLEKKSISFKMNLCLATKRNDYSLFNLDQDVMYDSYKRVIEELKRVARY